MYGIFENLLTYRKLIFLSVKYGWYSDPDPDPNPHVFGPPGSVIQYTDPRSRIRLKMSRIRNTD